MAQIIPIRDLKNTASVSDLCKKTGEPIFITKNGYGDMVIMNIDVYNNTIAKMTLSEALKTAEENFDKPGVDAFEFIGNLRKKNAKL